MCLSLIVFNYSSVYSATPIFSSGIIYSTIFCNTTLLAAEQTLADRRLFVLDDEQWQAFQSALDRPTQEKPQLKKLLTETGVFD